MSGDLRHLLSKDAVSAETRAFNDRIEALLAEIPPMNQLGADVIRAAQAEGKGVLPVGGPIDGSDWLDIPGAPGGPGRVRISEPDGDPVGIYLHIHGGGWALGSAEYRDTKNQQIARDTGYRVISVKYRLAPEDPWPAQQHDCMAAARWALGDSDLPMVIGGESAGGHLAAVTAIGLRDEGLGDRVKGLVLTYGVFDLRGTPSARNWGDRYLILSTPIMDWFFDLVDPDKSQRETANMSPLLADLEGLPPAIFLIGTEDPLLDDTLFMHQRWLAAGNSGDLKIYPGGIHGFDAFDELTIARDSHNDVVGFMKGAL